MRQLRLLLVDDDAALRTLLRTTFEFVDIEVEEVGSAAAATRAVRARPPDVILLGLGPADPTARDFCAGVKGDPATRGVRVVVLANAKIASETAALALGADALLLKPFRPLDLLHVLERVVGGGYAAPYHPPKPQASSDDLLVYGRDLHSLLATESGERLAVEEAYRTTVAALTSALESKDTGTRAHSQRVQQYALELAKTVDPALAEDPGTEYGFLLHDVGKLGIPDEILRKPAPLTEHERRSMQRHTVLGEQMLGGVVFLRGEGIDVVRSHHERWDGRGYPDRLAAAEIPLGARVFAVADALDAMTSDRPYRPALPWHAAGAEIRKQAGRQFDPEVVEAFRKREARLRAIHGELALD